MWTNEIVILLVFVSRIVSLPTWPDSDDCSVKPHLKCRLYRPDDCSPPALQAYFPALYNDTDHFPGEPYSFDAQLGYKNIGTYGLKPSANLTFAPRPDGSIYLTKGFEIMRYREGTAFPACYILDLTNATWTREDMNTTVFSVLLAPLMIGKLHVFELYSLPKPPSNLDQFKREISVLPQAITSEARSWQANISWKKLERERIIMVGFNSPPENFGFENFIVYLNDVNTSSVVKRNTTNETLYNFTDVTPGNYQIWVEPYDPYFATSEMEKCLCSNCVCITVKTTVFEMKSVELPTSPTSPTLTTATSTEKKTVLIEGNNDNDVSDLKIAMSVVGAILGMILVAFFAVFAYYQRCRSAEEPEVMEKYKPKDGDCNENDLQNNGYEGEGSITTVEVVRGRKPANNLNANKIIFDKKPKVFLLYEEDHEFHRKVVDNFAKYMQQHCQCNVMCVEWHLDAPWVHQELQQADFTVIINSEGAYRSYTTKNGYRNRDFDRQHSGSLRASSINSIRNKFLTDDRYDNIVMVYFDYTDEQFILPEICPGYKYKLPKHFTDFLLHIHKLHRTEDLSKYDLPFDGNHRLRPVGQQLLDSIAAALKFEKENPKWSFQKFGMYRSCSHASDESQLDSGLPEDLNSPCQTPITEAPEPWSSNAVQRHLQAYLTNASQDTVTINPSDVNFVVNETRPDDKMLKLSPHSFDPKYYNIPSHLPSPPTGSSEESGFSFLPPDDYDDDSVSKTVSEQMMSIVDRYQACSGRGSSLRNGYQLGNSEGGHSGGYNRNVDLDLLRVQSGEIQFTSLGIDEDGLSLGGESV